MQNLQRHAHTFRFALAQFLRENRYRLRQKSDNLVVSLPHELFVLRLAQNAGHCFPLDMFFFADSMVRLPGEFLGEDAGLDDLRLVRPPLLILPRLARVGVPAHALLYEAPLGRLVN